MRSNARLACMVLIAASFVSGIAAISYSRGRGTQADNRTSVALGTSGPAFTVNDQDLHSPLTLVAYGDMRFTDPTNVTATNPAARRALVQRVAEEKPDAILLNGDVPWHGGNSFGPRYFADMSVYFVFLLVPALEAVANAGKRRTLLVLLTALLVGVSVFVHHRGATTFARSA